MKHLKKALLTLLLIVMTMCVSVPVFAAAQKGLVKKGGKYYYYKSGKMLKNTWKRVKQNKVRYKFYFGSNGAAVKAKKTLDGSYNVKVTKIKGKQYGFDTESHLVAAGTYVDNKGRIWVFTAKGTVDTEKTTQLRNTFSEDQISKDLYDRVIATFGEPVKPVEEAASCYGWEADLDNNPFVDLTFTYPYFQVQLTMNKNTKEYKFTGYMSAKA